MSAPTDLVVVGAGPAGMAAAIAARDVGLTVSVVDQQHEPGGQIYRSVERVSSTRAADAELLGAHYQHGVDLVRRFRAADIDYRPQSSVWQIDAQQGVCFTDGTRSRVLAAGHVLIANGAMERPVPIPGWTLPGVMGAGAAQVLFKNAGLIPAGPVVLAGAGPLLLLVAMQMLRAGANLLAVLEQTRPLDYLRAAPWLLPALRNISDLRDGLDWRRQLRRAGVRLHSGISALRAEGTDRVERVSFSSGDRLQHIDASTLLLHDGVLPHTQLARQAGCAHEWFDAQRYWRPRLDAWGASSLDRVHVAGDCGGIMGARVAEAQGTLAALDIARRAGAIGRGERDEHAQIHHEAVARHGAMRPLLDRLFVPDHERTANTDDDTVLCRCEEITAGEVRAATRLGATGANQLKSYTRCGMGPCQGRMCMSSTAEVIAAQRRIPIDSVDPLRIRPPIVPISIGELAQTEAYPGES